MRYALFWLLAAGFVLQSPNAAAVEPTVDEVRSVALRHAGLHRRLDRWSARARLRHLLPEVTVEVGRIDQRDDNVQFDEWLIRDAADALIWDSARNQNEANHRLRTDYTIRATIDLGGLVFDPVELGAAREGRAQYDARLELTSAVHDAYFERLAAIDDLRATDTNKADLRRAAARRVQRLNARLDALTGGWFAHRLREAP